MFSKICKYLVLFIFSTFLLISTAIAGGGHSGGADILRCGSDIYLADTYELYQSGHAYALDELTSDYLKQVVQEFLNKHSDKYGDRVFKKLKKLFFNPGNVNDVHDDHIDLPAKCQSKAQLAEQEITTGVVTYDPALLAKLSKHEREVFFPVHEAMVAIEQGPNNTTYIRQQMADLLMSLLFQYLKELKHADRYLKNSLIGKAQDDLQDYHFVNFKPKLWDPEISPMAYKAVWLLAALSEYYRGGSDIGSYRKSANLRLRDNGTFRSDRVDFARFMVQGLTNWYHCKPKAENAHNLLLNSITGSGKTLHELGVLVDNLYLCPEATSRE